MRLFFVSVCSLLFTRAAAAQAPGRFPPGR